jgi:hypothetical protein
MAAGKYINNGTLSEKFFARMRSLKANNNHGDAYEEASQVLGQPELRDQFARLNREQARLGHLPHHLCNERHRVYDQLMAVAKRQLSQAQYDRFYLCF